MQIADMKRPVNAFAIMVSIIFIWVGDATAGYVFKDLGPLHGFYGMGLDINNSNQIVGELATYENGYEPTIWNNLVPTNLGTLGGDYGGASAVNALGQAVGRSRTTGSPANYHATLWSGGAAIDLAPNGGDFSIAYDINLSGQVVGQVGLNATLWSGSSQTDLSYLGGSSSAYGINDRGQIVGTSDVNGQVGSAVPTLWEGNQHAHLQTLGGSFGIAYDINNKGQIVGDSATIDRYHHATLWEGTSFVDLGTLGGDESFAYSINNSDQIVGYSILADRLTQHAALWNDDAIVDLNSFLDPVVDSGWVLVFASSINDEGYIVGRARHYGFEDHAFLLSPVPEPESYIMILAGLGMIGIMSSGSFTRRRRTPTKGAFDPLF